MTITARLNAANDILASINRDLDNWPTFTMTRDQLRARIDEYCTDPETDQGAIYRMLEPLIRCFRD